MDGDNFPSSCSGRAYFRGFCIFEVPLRPLAAFGGLLRDPIGSTEYWEIDRAVMRFLKRFFLDFQKSSHEISRGIPFGFLDGFPTNFLR